MSEPQQQAVLSYFEERFGIPLTVFAGYRLLDRGKTYALLRDSSHLEQLARLKVQNVGLTVLRKIRQHVKPTTVALQHFGRHATEHMLTLSEAQMTALLQDRALPMQLAMQPGYVILLHADHILGCGLYTPGVLRSQLPRHLKGTP